MDQTHGAYLSKLSPEHYHKDKYQWCFKENATVCWLNETSEFHNIVEYRTSLLELATVHCGDGPTLLRETKQMLDDLTQCFIDA